MRNLKDFEKFFENDFFDNFAKMSLFKEKKDFLGELKNEGNFVCES